MGHVVKFPTLITEPSNDGFVSQRAMIDNAIGILERYNNRNEDERLVIHTRGKTKEKVIKSINTSRLECGEDHCLLLKIEEFKQGYGDLYLASGQEQIRDITSKDKLGSKYNYAMMYPYISHDRNDNAVNRWVVFIYAAADKDDRDLINTVKTVVSKVLGKRFLNVIKENKERQSNYPWVSVVVTSAENVNNEDLRFHQYVFSAKEKNSKEIWYQNVPKDEAECLKNDINVKKGGVVKKIVKYFTSDDKKSYMKYEYELDGQGTISSTMMEKYSYSIQVDNINKMYNPNFMEQCFLEVLTRFLKNE